MNWINKLKQNKGAILLSVILAIVFIIVIKNLFFTPTQVKVTSVSRQDIKSEVQGTGTVTVDVLAKTGSKITGRIKKVLADENEIVQKGQTVALLEDTDFRRKIEQKRAQLYADTVKAWQAKRAWEREKELVATGAVSQEEAEAFEERYRVAQSQVEASRADLRYQQFKLTETKVPARVGGKVIKRWVEAGEGVVAGQPVVTIADTSVIMVAVNVDQRHASKIRKGQPATVLLRGRAGEPIQGEVYRVNPQADPVTEEMLVEVALQLPVEELQIGQWAEVYIQTGLAEKSLAVLKAAMISKESNHFVFIGDSSGTAQRVKVTPGPTSPRLSLVPVTGDLKPGEHVILNPSANGLQEGETVSIAEKVTQTGQ